VTTMTAGGGAAMEVATAGAVEATTGAAGAGADRRCRCRGL
jgi:hypothetical protein